MRLSGALLSAIVLFIGGCASEVVRYPIDLSNIESPQVKRYITLQSSLVRFDSGYDRTINAGTEFAEIGSVKQGKVLKPMNSVFAIEGAHAHEAYPVVENSRIVGFYLPVERAFAPLSNSVDLILQERNAQK